MRKVVILFVCLFLLSGCQNIDDLTIEEVLQSFSSDIKTANIYRTGYKFNLPDRLIVESTSDFTQILSSEKYNYYLYVDVVSYYNDITIEYDVDNDIYYSEKFEFDEKTGYLDIELKENDKYLIEIMYNYAKIEVMVDYEDINIGLINSISILKNIVYSDDIIDNYFGDDVLNFTEEVFDIFNTNEN